MNKSKMRSIIVMMVVVIAMVGCVNNNEKNLVTDDIKTDSLENVSATANPNDNSDIMASGGDVSNKEEDSTYMTPLEDVLGLDINKLTQDQLAELKGIYAKVMDFEFEDDDSNEEEFNDLNNNFYMKMRAFGLDVPFISYGELADFYRQTLSKDDYELLIKKDDQLNMLSEEEEESEAIVATIEGIFEKYNLSGEEISSQVMNRSVLLGLFEIEGNGIRLSNDSLKTEKDISKKEMETYNRLWAHVSKIIPSEYMSRLTKFEINTDGYEEVMAHVVEETEDFSKWRLAIDIKDALDKEGDFSDEFTNTVIHELGHVITLNKSQLQQGKNTDETTYSTIEGALTKESILNNFFQSFWKTIEEEHAQAVVEDENGGNYQGDAIYAFFEKYEDSYVSDYAATNPAEDFAETYRVFVTNNRPTDDAIKSQKIRSLYNYPELVKCRDEIRVNLGL